MFLVYFVLKLPLQYPFLNHVFVFVFDIVFVYLVQPLFPGPPSPLNRGPTRPGNRWSLLSISDCLPPPFNWHHTLSAKFCICIFILSLLSISEYCLSSTFNWHLTIQSQFFVLLVSLRVRHALCLAWAIHSILTEAKLWRPGKINEV